MAVRSGRISAEPARNRYRFALGPARSARHRRRSGWRQPNLPLLALVGYLLAYADAFALGVPANYSFVVGAFAVLILVAAAGLVGGGRLASPRRVLLPMAGVALLAFQVMQFHRVISVYGSGPWLTVARDAGYLLPSLGLVVVVGSRRVSAAGWYALLAVFLLGVSALLVASPRPDIDVWYLAQHASRCIVRGCDPYTMYTPLSPEVKAGFSYLPGTALLATPFWVIFGETRGAEVAAVVLSAVLLARTAPGRYGRVAGVSLLCIPGTLVAIEVGWNDSLLLVALVGAAWAWRRGSSVWTVVFLAAAFTTKQYAVLLVPLALLTFGWRRAVIAGAVAAGVMAPWVLAAPQAFYRNAVHVFFTWPPRHDSLTVWVHLPPSVRGWAPYAAVAVAYGLVCWAVPRSPGGWLLASGLLLAVFDLFNKFTYYNEWAFAAGLIIGGALCSAGERYGSAGERYGSAGERYEPAGENCGPAGESYGSAGERNGREGHVRLAREAGEAEGGR